MDHYEPQAGIEDFVDALDERGEELGVIDTSVREPSARVAELRRRRARLAHPAQDGYQDFVLMERDGVLLWTLAHDATQGSAAGGLRRGRRAPAGNVIKEVSVPVPEPNEYVAALRRTDRQLNEDCEVGLRRVQHVGGKLHFAPAADRPQGPFHGRTLVIVHGTFSHSKNALGEYAATAHGRKFLADALLRYRQVLVFDHPTLSVAPILNGLELARALAGSSGQIDVIAHSRGGLVARWWLEVFSESIAGAQVRVVLAGSPLLGTSLAAPSRIQPLLSVLCNVGAFVSQTMQLAAAANPFALASFALLKFVARREASRRGLPPVAELGERPGSDAAIAVIPGLQGQSAVSNNFELHALRSSPLRANVTYHALTADFDPEPIGWKLWQVIDRFGDRAKNLVADAIFPGANDLVVDTAHMLALAPDLQIDAVHAFGTQSAVHHCNYFRQAKTIEMLRAWLGVQET